MPFSDAKLFILNMAPATATTIINFFIIIPHYLCYYRQQPDNNLLLRYAPPQQVIYAIKKHEKSANFKRLTHELL